MKEWLRKKLPTDNLCLHCNTIPICPHAMEPILEPILFHDGKLYDREWLEAYLKVKNRLDSSVMIPVVISCSGAMTSKLDPRKIIHRDQSVIFIGRSNNNDDTAILMIEKQNKHGAGSICAFKFIRELPDQSKASLFQENFSDFQYSKITTQFLLDRFNIDSTQVKVRTLTCNRERRLNLETLIRSDEEKIQNGIYRYAYRSEKLVISLFGVFKSVSYYNSCSWARSALQRAAILSTPGIDFDREYRLRSNPMREKLLGATIDHVLPVIKNSGEPSNDETRTRFSLCK